MHVAKRMTQYVSNIKVPIPQPAVVKSAKRGISNRLMAITRLKADSILVTLKQTIVAILMAMLVELGATQWTKINVGSIVAFLHVKAKGPTEVIVPLSLPMMVAEGNGGTKVALQKPHPEVALQKPHPEVALQNPHQEVALQKQHPEVTLQKPHPEVALQKPLPEVALQKQDPMC